MILEPYRNSSFNKSSRYLRFAIGKYSGNVRAQRNISLPIAKYIVYIVWITVVCIFSVFYKCSNREVDIKV